MHLPDFGAVTDDRERSSSTAGRQQSGEDARLHYIDGLRAVAITLVVLHHFATGYLGVALTVHGWRVAGTGLGYLTNSGVELFFVLSGIVLLRPYLRGRRPFVLRRYVERRIARLWPPFIGAWLLAGAVVLYNSRSPSWYDALPPFKATEWIAQAGILNFGWRSYNVAWWSLTPELLFYVMAPIVVAVLARRRRAAAEIVIAMVVASVASIALWHPQISMPGVQHGPIDVLRQSLAYAPCFLAGVLLAQATLPRRVGTTLLVIGVGYLALVLFVERANVHTAFALLYTGVIVVAHTTQWVRRRLERPTMIWIGERSYSLFLTHFTVLHLSIALAAHLSPSHTVAYRAATRVAATLGTVIVSMLLFWFVERRYARNLATSGAFWPWQAHAAMEGSSTPSRP